ncbi:hypothetical protein WMQ46_22960 [Vibrio diabolicus]|uniref:hypothetical protein n=1 Tax=Vibrio diabolicus TaxID=50719 RepID=UPI0037514078
MYWWHNRFWYIPVAIVIAAGYLLGCYIWFATQYLDLFGSVSAEGRLFIELSSLGIVGGAMHCSIYFARDVGKKIRGDHDLPTFMHFIGYALQIIGGGITGVVLYLAAKVGLVVLIQSDSGVSTISPYAAWLLAFSGGFMTHLVKQFISAFVSGSLKNENEPKAEDKSQENNKPPQGKENT